MTYLKSKSEFNLAAAKLLIEDYDNYAPSVHCSYYGCFQFIKSKLNSLGYTYTKVNEEIAASETLHSHKYPISLIVKELKTKVTDDTYYSRKVNDKIKLLKTFREESDYHNKVVTYPQSKAALELSNEIIQLINKKL
ncbi:HEPN domain-containing protein [Flavobacterium hydatis]|uniref:HEPN domain-containing protein n=1 Tax=Flavobacterium hydatis TaxID=991 RepID=A0A086AKY0_FLAHY|nr:HEPN domain-containing protein [Flavobacterium hydatis]KFF17344.1 hypothetical protein IW20_08355 [Flavobacterium hydatis]OXA95177.1 hypothetical protein B0A62_09770 [Flavobacterium hydatis]